MRALFVAAALGFAITTHPAFADCYSILTRAKTRETIDYNREDFKKRLYQICDEQRDSQGGGVSGSLFGFSASLTTNSENFKRICTHKEDESLLEEAYRSYVERIAPGAMGALTECLAAKETDFDLRFFEAHQLQMLVNFKPHTTVDQAQIAVSTTGEGLSCFWQANPKDKAENAAKPLMLKHGATQTLTCNRRNSDQKSSVTVYRQDGVDRITIAWNEYDAKGVPIDTVAALHREISELKSALRAGSADPKDTVRTDRKGSAEGAVYHDPIHTVETKCDPGYYAAGIKFWGQVTGDCGGCFARFELICEKLNVDSASK